MAIMMPVMAIITLDDDHDAGHGDHNAVCESYSRVGHWWRISEMTTPEVVESF
jgi:hypothetical protein